MPSKNITFDPDAGVPKAANFTIHTGADFNANFNVVNTSNSAFNFTGYSGAASLTKSVSIGSSLYALRTFSVGLGSTGDSENLTLGLSADNTKGLKEGRYKYDVLVSSGTTVYRIVEGDVMVRAGVTSSV